MDCHLNDGGGWSIVTLFVSLMLYLQFSIPEEADCGSCV